MENLNIDLEIRVCVSEKDYDAVYDYLVDISRKITDKITKDYDCTSESYLE